MRAPTAGRRRPLGLGVGLALVGLLSPASVPARGALADRSAAPSSVAEEAEPRLSFRVEARTHYRDSDGNRFPSPFPFSPEMLPPGAAKGWMETVDAGSHVEVSTVSLQLDARFRPRLRGRLRIDLIDRYDRNPTSEDREVDVDEAWLLWGEEWLPATLPEGRGHYLKIGKLAKPERQNDRHLDSYGLVSTAFNRLEDVGLEAGLGLGDRFYLKALVTEGNPLFFRDPNALAGDNGTSIFNGSVLNPVSELKTGIPIFYDADVDTIGFAHPELGVVLGWRHVAASGLLAADVMAWAYGRELAGEARLHDTFYGGDLDLLLGPGNATPLPVTGHHKREIGADVWLYAGDVSFFGQIVDQDLAGLGRFGYEVEVAWTFDLPLFAALGGRQILPWIAPAVRYSKLDPDFVPHPQYPAPSVAWDWEKLDLGLRIGLLGESDLTIEWNRNDFLRLGREEHNHEFLVTLRLVLGPWAGGGGSSGAVR